MRVIECIILGDMWRINMSLSIQTMKIALFPHKNKCWIEWTLDINKIFPVTSDKWCDGRNKEKTSLGSGDSKEVLNEEDYVYAEQMEPIKMIMSSYDDTDSDDSQMNSEIENEIIEDIEQVVAEMKYQPSGEDWWIKQI